MWLKQSGDSQAEKLAVKMLMFGVVKSFFQVCIFRKLLVGGSGETRL